MRSCLFWTGSVEGQSRARLGTAGASSRRRAQGLSAYGRFFRAVCLDSLSLRYSLSRPSPSGNGPKKSPYRVKMTRLEPVGLPPLPAGCIVVSFGNDEGSKHTDHAASLVRTALHSIVCCHRFIFSFLLPRAKLRAAAPGVSSRFLSCCTTGLFRWCNTNVVARLLILRFIPGMVPAIKAASKLCAWNTRHAPDNFLSEISVAQLGKGKGFSPPRCIPTRVPRAAVETVPVSTPFGLIGAPSFRPWAVRP